MGKMSNGILGQTTGKVGNVVGSTWKGINTIRVHQPNVLNPKTAKQVAARSNMTTASQIGSTLLSSVIVPLWNRFAKKASGYNDFVKANIANMVNGEIDDYNLFTISMGKMAAPIVNSMSITGLSCTIGIDSNVGDAYALPTDELYCVILDAENDPVLFSGKIIGTRADLSGSDFAVALKHVQIGGAWAYLAWRRQDGTIVSNTVAYT